MILTLPWPPKACNPNARNHWTKLSVAKRRLRDMWFISARNQGAGRLDALHLTISLQFVPPDRRRRDMDNMLASCKAGMDGLSDLFGVDDSRWLLRLSIAPEPVKGGAVRVEVTPA